MASPQTEHGYTRIANEVIEALARVHLAGRENRILWAIFRQTYGFQRKEAAITFTTLEQLTGLRRRHIDSVLRELERRRILIITRCWSGNTYAFQKDYERWDSITENGNALDDTALPKMVMPALPFSVTEPLPELVIHERKKERERNMPRVSDDFLPEADIQSAMLLAGRGNGNHKNGRAELARVNWTLPSADLEAACAEFVSAADIGPPRAKSGRRDWVAALSEHIEEYGVMALKELYPLAVAKLRGNKLTVSRPGSLTKTLPAVAQELAHPEQRVGYEL